MSEYQYYEFHALDRRLTPREMDELRALSTRAQITPTSFSNFYNWGDLKGDPRRLVERYFDAFLYLANWGTRRLMFRLPSRLLPLETATRCCSGGRASAWAGGEHVIVELVSDRELDEVPGWEREAEENETGEGWLPSILPVRDELARGDLRALYLGWLLRVMAGELEGDAPEPPLPEGLGRLSAGLEAMVRFLRIDLDLVAAAAARTPDVSGAPLAEDEAAAWIARLPEQEKDRLLMRLLQGDPHLGNELLQRARRELGEPGRKRPPGSTGRPRTVSELLALAEKRGTPAPARPAEREHRGPGRR